MKNKAQLSRLEKTIFYIMEKSIKSYRQFAQRNIKQHNIELTIDQWLILKTIQDNPELTQKEIAETVFKDYASITRMIELLVKKGFLKRSFHDKDRRRFNLKLTSTGEQLCEKLIPIISVNRKTALEGLTQKEMMTLSRLLQKITDNCNYHS